MLGFFSVSDTVQKPPIALAIKVEGSLPVA
jgi:hypothetical protein